MKSALSVVALLPLVLAKSHHSSSEATVYLIRHGEQPKNGTGLSSTGQQRAQCLTNVFGSDSQYNIGHIMAETPKSNGANQRPYDTVVPLSQSLGLTIDTSCSQTDADCVANVVQDYSGSGNILICWEHKELNNIVEAMGSKKSVSQYPGNDYGVIWTDPYPYSGISQVSNEDCPGLGQ